MWFLFQIIFTIMLIILACLFQQWIVTLRIRRRLCKWLPASPRVPFLGSVFEFGPHTETLNDFARLTNNPEKATYAEIFRAPYILSRNYDFVEFILSSNALLNKSTDYDYFLDWLGTGLLTAPGPKWKQRRRIITPAFHFSILEQFIDVFESNGDKLIRKLHNEAVDKESVDIYQYLTDCALDIISGPKWKQRRRIITPAFHFSILEQFIDVFESNGDKLIRKLHNEAVDKESVDIYQYLTDCALDIISGPKWKQRRRIITPAFHFSILEQFIDVFESNGDKLIRKLHNEAVDKESVDIYQYLTDCALDIISVTPHPVIPNYSKKQSRGIYPYISTLHSSTLSDLNQKNKSAMGVSVNTQENKNQDYVYAVKDICRIILRRSLSGWRRIHFLFRFTKDYQLQKKYIQILHAFTNSIIDARQQDLIRKQADPELIDDLGRKRKLAFLDLLLKSKIDGKPLSKEEIREEVDTFMFEKRARAEQKEIYGKNRDRQTTYQDLQDMRYLELVIKEALRLYPPVPFISRTIPKDIEYKGNLIPRGTAVTIFIYGINRDPEYHEAPEDFKPERFLNEEKGPFAYIPFSAGPRNCIGQKFAMLEMKCEISKILRHFELHPTDPVHQMELVSEAILKSQNGVRLRLKKHDWSG